MNAWGESRVAPETASTAAGRLVLLKPGCSGPGLFMVPGLGGKVDGLVAFAALLETEMPVFGIEGRGLDGESEPETDLDTIAEQNLMELQTVQPTGPYYLLGHSFGGLVAYEMARRLIADTEQVACLILLDTPVSQKFWPFFYYLTDVAARFRRHSAKLLALPLADKIEYGVEHFRKFARKFYDPYGLRHQSIDVMIGDRMAYDRFCPRFYPEKLIFFRATIKDMPADPEICWRQRVGALEVRSAPGGHNSMLHPPHVAPLAEDVSRCLAQSAAPDRIMMDAPSTGAVRR